MYEVTKVVVVHINMYVAQVLQYPMLSQELVS